MMNKSLNIKRKQGIYLLISVIKYIRNLPVNY